MTITDYIAQAAYQQRERDLIVSNERHRRALSRRPQPEAGVPRARRRFLALLRV